MRFWDTLGEYDAESTTYSALAGGAGSSPYFPQCNGKLKGLRATVGRDAASTLTNHGEFRLTCPLWNVTVKVLFNGSGLQTAPALMAGDGSKLDWEIELPVATGSPITIEGRDLTADTTVTSSVILSGLFEF